LDESRLGFGVNFESPGGEWDGFSELVLFAPIFTGFLRKKQKGQPQGRPFCDDTYKTLL